MKKLLCSVCALLLGAVAASAQNDVTSQYLTNADFSQGTPITVGVCTYDYDAEKNGTEFSQLQPVEGWDIVENGNARAGGLVAFGSGVWIGGPGYTAPKTNSDGVAEGNILGLVGVWTGLAQYTQDVTLPEGTYTLVLAVYNSVGGSTAFAKNLIGFIEDGGTEHLATTTVYPVNNWKYEFITFTLASQTTGKFSLGYKGSNDGSASAQHLFLSGIQLFDGEIDADAYEQAKIDALNAQELAENKEKLAGSSFENPSADLLVNGSFDTAGQGWTLENMGYQQNGERPTRYAEKWDQTLLSVNGSATQTIKNVPAGAYHLKGTVNAQLQSDQSLEITGVTLSVNDEVINCSGPWTDYEIVYNLESDGDVKVTFAFSETNANWVGIDQFSLIYGGDYNQYVSDKESLGPKKAYDEAKAAAEAALANEAYVNVSGDEKSTLESLVNASEPSGASAYETATEELLAVTKVFIDAAPAYNSLAAANAAAEEQAELPYADQSLKPESETGAQTAEDASQLAESVWKHLREYHESNQRADAVSGTVDRTDFIANAEALSSNDGWTIEGKMNEPRNTESWTDAEGNHEYFYFDGGDWGATGWTTTLTQTFTLPQGKYLLSAKGRASANTTLTMNMDGNSVELPNIGASGNIFNRGWGNGYLEFTTDGSTENVLSISATTEANHEWFSIGGFMLIQLEGDTETAISQVESATEQQTVFDLQGRRMNGQLQKGVYIVGGKKVIR